jgi:hypothetical protein
LISKAQPMWQKKQSIQIGLRQINQVKFDLL